MTHTILVSRWRFALIVGAVGLILVSVYLLWWLRADVLDATAAVWTLWAGAGVAAMIVLLWQAIHDVWEYRRNGAADKAVVNIGYANIRRESLRLVKVIALFIIGVTVLTETSNAFVSRLLLILVAAGIVANALLDLLEREQTAELLRSARRE